MAYFPESVLDAIETLLASGLRRDAAAMGRMEATTRVLLAIGPEEAIRMREVARRIARDPSTVTRFVLRAQAQGLVESRAGSEDRRERHVALTPTGRTVREDLLRRRLAQAAGISRGVQARTGLGPDEVNWFLEALHASLAEGSR